MMDIFLGVNIDHIATLRQARGTRYPSLIDAAKICESSGADSITLHLREDRRHIQDQDVEELKSSLTTKMNLEMAATDEMLEIATKILPEDCCLVPDNYQIEAAIECGAPIIEIHTGHYADASSAAEKQKELQKISEACAYAHSLGLQVNAGHGLTLENTKAIAEINSVVELNIGHSIISRALFVGLGAATSEMKQLIQEARGL
jgi:pyridoxine 5-phosphate synthase